MVMYLGSAGYVFLLGFIAFLVLILMGVIEVDLDKLRSYFSVAPVTAMPCGKKKKRKKKK